MESKKEVMHTPEPWFYQEDSDEYTHIIRPESNPGMIVVHLRQDSTGKAEADARRIVACVNACSRFSTEHLENYPLISEHGFSMYKSVKAQRDELLAALKRIERFNGLKSWFRDIASSAIAKCEVKS